MNKWYPTLPQRVEQDNRSCAFDRVPLVLFSTAMYVNGGTHYVSLVSRFSRLPAVQECFESGASKRKEIFAQPTTRRHSSFRPVKNPEYPRKKKEAERSSDDKSGTKPRLQFENITTAWCRVLFILDGQFVSPLLKGTLHIVEYVGIRTRTYLLWSSSFFFFFFFFGVVADEAAADDDSVTAAAASDADDNVGATTLSSSLNLIFFLLFWLLPPPPPRLSRLELPPLSPSFLLEEFLALLLPLPMAD